MTHVRIYQGDISGHNAASHSLSQNLVKRSLLNPGRLLQHQCISAFIARSLDLADVHLQIGLVAMRPSPEDLRFPRRQA